MQRSLPFTSLVLALALGACAPPEPADCPPVPDAGDLQTLCQELYPAADAGPCPACDDCSEAPTVGVEGPGRVHNLMVAHFVKWAPDTQMKVTDPDDGKIDTILAEGQRMVCANQLGECAAMEAELAQLGVAYKAARALREEGQTLSQVYLPQLRALPEGERPPEWALSALENLQREVLAGGKTQAELLAVIDQIGRGQGKYDGGNLGRVLRSVGKASLKYWAHYAATTEGVDDDDDIVRHWLLTDIGFAYWSGPVGAAASALDWYLDVGQHL